MPRPTSSPVLRASASVWGAPDTGGTHNAHAVGAVAALAAELADGFESVLGAHRHVVLAVSGGVDSTALMHLAQAWAKARGGPAVSVATVDHGLRPGSAAAAAAVARDANALGLAHATLIWQGSKPATGIQEAAREARYRRLAAHLLQCGATALATAHTEDDQAETVLMRLARGSGLDGLGAMMPRTQLYGVPVLRPLLGVPKARLTAALVADGIGWIEDPSNDQPEFERVRLRLARAELDAAGLGSAAIARSARRLARARAAIDATVERAIGDGLATGALVWRPLGYGDVSWTWLLAQPEEVRLRLLSQMIQLAGGQGATPSLAGLEAMTVAQGWRLPGGATLGGALVRPRGAGRVLVCREYGRGQPAPSELVPGGGIVWDRRFEIVAGPGLVGPVRVAALGPAGVAHLRGRGRTVPAAPARVLWTLPAVLEGDRVIGVAADGFDPIGGARVAAQPVGSLGGRPVSGHE